MSAPIHIPNPLRMLYPNRNPVPVPPTPGANITTEAGINLMTENGMDLTVG